MRVARFTAVALSLAAGAAGAILLSRSDAVVAADSPGGASANAAAAFLKSLPADLRADQKDGGALAGLGKLRPPLPIAPVEDEDRIAALEPQHVAQIVRLLGAAGNRGTRGQVRLHEQALRIEVVAGHVAILLHLGVAGRQSMPLE